MEGAAMSGISDDLRQDYLDRGVALEQSFQRLIQAVVAKLPADQRRDRRRHLSAKLDVLSWAMEETILLAAGEVAPVDLEIDRIHELSDELIHTRATLDRQSRKAQRELEGLSIEERRMRAEQLRRELDAESGED